MTRPSTPYAPINCEFHDVLEATATRRSTASIRFMDEDGAQQQRNARIIALYANGGSEYAELDTGERIRLDRLVSVDGEVLADYTPPT
jgi:Rho-binding antiterminator